MSNKIERRTINTTELRASEGDEPALIGYAATFGVLSKDLGGFREVIRKGAFSRSLAAGDDVVCTQQHDVSKILGRRSAGTLALREDEKGLLFECRLDPNNSDAMNLRAAVLRGDIKECSFMFTTPDGGDDFSEDVDERGQRFIKRTLKDVNLLEVSAVVFPAYNQPGATFVGARSADSDTSVEGRKRWLEQQQADWKRQERAHEIGLQVLRDVNLAEQRGTEDFVSMREKLQTEMCGYSYLAHDEDYVYGLSDDDDDDRSIYRFGYELDDEGNVTVDEDSRTKFTAAEVSSAVRSAVESVFADRELRFRMRAAAGISVR